MYLNFEQSLRDMLEEKTMRSLITEMFEAEPELAVGDEVRLHLEDRPSGGEGIVTHIDGDRVYVRIGHTLVWCRWYQLRRVKHSRGQD